MEKVIAWDIDRFPQLIKKVNDAMRIIQEQVDQIRTLQFEARTGWQSEAGFEYATSLIEDMEKLRAVQTDLQSLREILIGVNDLYDGWEWKVYEGIANVLNVTE